MLCACLLTSLIVVLDGLLGILLAREGDGGGSGGLSAGVEVDHAARHLADALEDLTHILVGHI